MRKLEYSASAKRIRISSQTTKDMAILQHLYGQDIISMGPSTSGITERLSAYQEFPATQSPGRSPQGWPHGRYDAKPPVSRPFQHIQCLFCYTR